MKLIRKKKKKLFYSILSLFMLIGLTNLVFIFEPSSVEAQSKFRSPSSLVSAMSTLQTLELKCDENSIKIKSHAEQVRIKGTFCNPTSFDQAHLSLKNKTNGHKGTFFKIGNSGFTTDFIHLENGTNVITLSYNYQGQAQEYEFIILK